MKRNYAFILIAFLFFANAAYSQLDKNTWLVGGTGTFNSTNGSYKYYTNDSYMTSKITAASVYASVGYFVVNKLAFGLRPGFTWSKEAYFDDGGGSSNSQRYTLGPFGRYYFLNNDKPFNIVGDLSYQFGIVKHQFGDQGNINNLSVMAGPVIFFNTSVGLEVLLGYNYNKEKIKDYYDIKTKSFQVSVSFLFHLEKE